MRTGLTFLLLVGVACLLNGCSGSAGEDPDGAFVALGREYIEKYLRLYPERATALGDHRFDGRLNDYSAAGVADGIELSKTYLKSLRRIDPDALDAVNRVDYHILVHHLEKSVYSLETLREFEWNPLRYNVGGAIYDLVARDFAPLEERVASLKTRLEMVPRAAAMAKANLKNPPKIHIETAILQNQGTIGLIREGLDAFLDDSPEFVDELAEAREMAADALEYYGSWLERDLLPESDGEFRIGKKKFERKLGFTLDSSLSMDDIARRAEADLAATQLDMFETARPIYEEFFGEAPQGASSADRKKVIRAVLDKLAEARPANDTIVERAKSCLESCTRFVTESDLVRVPVEPVNLIVMPEFKRGVAVAYCDAPGPLDREAGTFFAISPTPEDWPQERVDSFFREYNDHMLYDLTIHEAMPGHYLQLAHANRFEAPTLIRAVFASGTFVEGWATYSEQLMVEKGFGGPEVKMQQLKMRLRMIINAIIDQKIHTAGMTEEEAITLMTEEGFQEQGEAAGKWRRACLTSTQLSTYYVGNIEMNEIRAAFDARNGADADLRSFHDALLSFGSPPPKFLRELLGF